MSQMQDAPHSGGDRAEVRVATAAETDDLAADTVFLSSKLQGHKIRRVELIRGGRGVINGQGTQEESNIAQLERLGVARGACVFAGAEEKIKC